MKEFWIILQEKVKSWFESKPLQLNSSNAGNRLILPVVGSKPVERSVKLDDVCAKENKISYLELEDCQCKINERNHSEFAENEPSQHLKSPLCDKIGTEQRAGQ